VSAIALRIASAIVDSEGGATLRERSDTGLKLKHMRRHTVRSYRFEHFRSRSGTSSCASENGVKAASPTHHPSGRWPSAWVGAAAAIFSCATQLIQAHMEQEKKCTPPNNARQNDESSSGTLRPNGAARVEGRTRVKFQPDPLG